MALNSPLLFSMLSAVLLVGSCGEEPPAPPPRAPDHVAPEALKEHVAVLASDALEGRDTGTKGYDEAAVYVAKQMRAKGLQPAGVKGTYFQPIVFKEMRVIADSAQLVVRGQGAPTLLQYAADYYFFINPRSPRIAITAPLVYAGYGVTAPDYGLDSYAGMEMAGKIAVVLSGVPEGLPPEEGAVFSSVSRKAADALQAGAAGVALIYSLKDEKVYPYESRSQRAVDNGSITWIDDAGSAYSSYGDLSAIIRFSPEAGETLFDGAEHSYEAVRKAAFDGEALASFELPVTLSISHILEERSLVSSNVIAKLPANAPAAADGEDTPKGAVLLMAHLDHLGIGNAVDGDEIYNGAVDNALGVASILEAASAAAALPQVRGRDLYIAALTSEENGLLGAEYLARHLPMPTADLVAVLNIDMPVAFYPFAAVQASGEVHSSLGALAGQAAKQYGLGLEDDPMPEEAIFVRSDHYAFVERGIPSVYLNIGVTTPEGSEIDGLAELDGFLMTHYHMPSDEITLPIDWQAAARFADVHVEILRTLLTTDIAVEWAEDSFFNQPRALD